MEDWLDIINDENEADDGALILPQPQFVDVNANGSIQKEISYRFDDMNPENVIRTERIFEVVDTKKKVSNAAILRKKTWKKFGECKNTPKGETERGVTNQRDGNFLFKWNGRGMQRKQVQTAQPIKRKKATEQKEQKMAPPPIEKSGKYVPPWMKKRNDGTSLYSSPFDDDDKVEIKISNLPQWSEFMNVKHLIDEFYRKHLKQRYIPKYRIRMIPSKRTLEEWHAQPKVYAHRLAEYERLAIVEFENEAFAMKAIKTLDGHHYDSHILRVEKALPRKF